MEISDIISYLAPVLTGVVGFLGGRRKQKNDFLNELQSSIDLLAEKNRQLMEEVVKLREDNACLRVEVVNLRKDNEALRVELEELNRRLENVKTITKRI